MLTRFKEPRRLREALLAQKLIHGEERLADILAGLVEVRSYQAGNALVAQGATDDHVCLLLAGSVEIVVNGRPVAKRFAGEHIGEMALLSPDARRSATVVALEEVVAACVSEEHFSRVAQDFPVLWRRIASSLGDRLRQRGQYVRQRNETPIMFIGSSREGLAVARGIQAGLSYDNVIPRVWTDDIFGASGGTLEAIERELLEVDFGVLVLTPDDRIVSRGQEQDAPRDNVVFELGLLMGAIGRSRTYFVLPRDQDTRIPSDLFGMTPLTYVPADGADLAARLGHVCTALREKLRDLGAR